MGAITTVIDSLLVKAKDTVIAAPDKCPVVIRIYSGQILALERRVQVKSYLKNRCQAVIGIRDPVDLGYVNARATRITIAPDMQFLDRLEVPITPPDWPLEIDGGLTLQPSREGLLFLSRTDWTG